MNEQEPEIFHLIIASNRMRESLARIESKVDFLSKPLSQQLNKQFLTSDEAAKILKISKRTLAKIRSEHQIPYIKVRKRIIFAANDLEGYLKERKN
jgi:excisionase family DNA binding protein